MNMVWPDRPFLSKSHFSKIKVLIKKEGIKNERKCLLVT
jgi:hypothetical protein